MDSVFIIQIFAPSFICPAQVSHNLPADMQRKWAGLFPQHHSGLFGGLISLPVITFFAAGNQIFPRRSAAARTRQNMIQSQFGRLINLDAILTPELIAQKDILPRKRPPFMRNMAIFHQPDNRWRGHRKTWRMQQMAVMLFHPCLSLKDHHHRPPLIADIDRFIGGI